MTITTASRQAVKGAFGGLRRFQLRSRGRVLDGHNVANAILLFWKTGEVKRMGIEPVGILE